MSGQPWTVDFWLDPACPLTRVTARWITAVAQQVALDVRWRVMSLSVLNEHREVDPEGDEAGYLWIPARVAAAVRAGHGSAALGAFHAALWTDPDGTEREWIGDIEEALRRCDLPAELLGAGFTTDHDGELRRSHHEGVDRVDAEIGTPVLAITTPAGDQHALFGPVLSSLPAPADAVRLWEGVLLLVGVPGFREIKA